MRRAGRLDRLIALQSRTDPAGGDPTAQTWATDQSVWAEKMDARGVERFLGGQFIGEATQAYRIRYLADVNPLWRVKDGSELWNIVAAHEGDGRRSETILQVKRFDPNDEA
jgi:head-tail adaptor